MVDRGVPDGFEFDEPAVAAAPSFPDGFEFDEAPTPPTGYLPIPPRNPARGAALPDPLPDPLPVPPQRPSPIVAPDATPNTAQSFGPPMPAPEPAVAAPDDDSDFGANMVPNFKPTDAKGIDTSGIQSVAKDAAIKGIADAVKTSAQAATPFQDVPQTPDNSKVGQLLQTPLSQGWKDPQWWTAQMVHGAVASSPALGLGAAGALAGEAVAPEGGGLVGGAAGMGVGSMIQAIAPAYQKARAEGLDHDAAVQRAWKETGLSGAFGFASGLAPGVKVFGPATEDAILKPISEALAQIAVIQPGIMATQKASENAVEGKNLMDGVPEAAVVGAATGAGITAVHGAVTAGARAVRGAPEAPSPSAEGQMGPDEIDSFLARAEGAKTHGDIQDFIRRRNEGQAFDDKTGTWTQPSPVPALPGPAAPQTSAPADTAVPPAPAGPTPSTAGPSPTAAPPTKAAEDATLRATGYTQDDIDLLSPGERAAELAQAKANGLDPAKAGSSSMPTKIVQPGDIDAARDQVNTAPTPGQIDAGNYRKGHVVVDGLPISIENPKGSTRSGVGPDGTPWSVQMPGDYGYIKGSVGADGDHVDVYIGDQPPNGTAYVVDQIDPATGKFDEHKAIMGVSSADEAAALYQRAFSDGKGLARIGGITQVPTSSLKEWLAKGNQSKPIAPADQTPLPPGFEPVLAPETALPSPPADSASGGSSPAAPQPSSTLPAVQGNRAPATPRQRAPQSLVSFLQANGGVRDTGGDLKAMGATKFPGLVSRNGMSPDRAREMVAEAGYLGPDTEHAVANTTPRDLFDAIERHPTYSVHDQDRVLERHERAAHEAETQKAFTKAREAMEDYFEENYEIPRNEINQSILNRATHHATEGMHPEDAINQAFGEDLQSTPSEFKVLKDATPEIPWFDDETGSHPSSSATPRSDSSEETRVSQGPSPTGPPALVENGEGRRDAGEDRSDQSQGGAASSPPEAVAQRLAQGPLSRKDAFGLLPQGLDRKSLEEMVEHGVVLAARHAVEQGGSPQDVYGRLVEIYKNQPALTARTSTSVLNQAYSTPAPLAYVAAQLAGIGPKTTVFEPTAGNGMLLITADPKNVTANEIDPRRAQTLAEQGFKTTNLDATDLQAVAKQPQNVDAVIANPPFGVVKVDGQSKRFDLAFHRMGYATNEIDHAIALNALSSMKPDGKAVLILGGIGKLADTPKARADSYAKSKAKREFYKALYDAYNVTDHFTASGDLYAKQGAAWPVDVIAIDGRGKSALPLPGVKAPPVLNTWDEIGTKLNEIDNRPRAGSAETGNPTAETSTTGARAPDAGNRVQTEQRGPDELRPDDAQRGTVRPNSDLGQRPDQLGASETRPAERQDGNGPSGSDRSDHAERPSSVVGSFQTAKGSEYAIHDDGTTTRNKAARADVGHEGDFGIKPRSEKTVYLDKNASDLSAAGLNGLGPKGARIAIKNGRAALLTWNDQAGKWGAAPDGRNVPFHTEPAVGRYPLEMWKSASDVPGYEAYSNMHASNQITKIEGVQQKATSEEPAPAPKPGNAPIKSEKETETQVAYQPAAQRAKGLGTLVPVNMRTATQEALNRVIAKHGTPDDYVAQSLGYKPAEIEHYFSAEQVDALALAIDNMEKGAGLIIGDQTGIGKGRVVAGVIRYALKKGWTPIFVTEKPNLYGDMFRDLSDIGIQKMLGRDPRILMTNASQKVPLDEEGKVILKTPDTKSHYAALNGIAAKGKLDKHDMVFTTYSQMQTVKSAETPQRQMLRALAPNAVTIFDEAHNAGGQADKRVFNDPKKPPPAPDRAAFARELVDLSKATFYSSATYAKRPDVMDLYRKTDMRYAVDDLSKLGDAIAEGGLPMQQAVAAALAESGQYVRRERSFDGVNYDVQLAPTNRTHYRNFATALRAVNDFSKAAARTVKEVGETIRADGQIAGQDSSVGDAGASSTNFTSIMHNLVGQYLLATKAEQAAQLAVQSIKAGERPILTAANTMESFLSDYMESTGKNVGDPIDLNFNDLLERYLERSRIVREKKPFGEASPPRRLTDKELGPAGVAAYKNALETIRKSDFGDLPVSPIDRMRQIIQEAGYKVGEITGRDKIIDYTGGSPTISQRPSTERSVTGRRQAVADFNSRAIDAIILNQSGATGLSLHDSAKFPKSGRGKRHMIIAQAEGNIDTHMQMLGRPHRTGQVSLPRYTQFGADVAAERRPMAILAKKMASLNANTTANKSSALTAKDTPDFMNAYGDRVAAMAMEDDPQLHSLMDSPLGDGDKPKDDGMRRVTGRIAMLDPDVQDRLMETLETNYKALIEHLDATGQNLLDTKSLPLDAKYVKGKDVAPRTGDGPFREAVHLGEYDTKSDQKPVKFSEAMQYAAMHLDIDPENVPENPGAALRMMQEAGKQLANQKQKAALAAFESYRRENLDGVLEDAARENISKAMNAQQDAFSDLAKQLYPGARVTLKTPDENLSGIVTAMGKSGKTVNPLALSSWRIKMAIPGKGMLEIPFSQLSLTEQDGKTLVAPNESWVESPEQTQQRFDAIKDNVREKRLIATGNTLGAFTYLKNKGRIAHFTMADGSTRQGIVLPRSFKSIESVQAMAGKKLQSGAEIVPFFEKRPKSAITSGDGLVRITKSGYIFKVAIDPSRAKGGKYFLDRDVIDAAGGDFAKSAGTMNVTAHSVQIARITDALIKAGARFEVPVTEEEASKPTVSYSATPAAVPPAPSMTPRARDVMPDMVKRATEIIDQVAGPYVKKVEFHNKLVASDPGAALASGAKPGAEAAGFFNLASKLIGVSLSPKFDPRDTAFHEAFHALEFGGAFTPDEMKVMARELPRMRARVQRIYGATDEQMAHMSASEVRANAFAAFANGREDAGAQGENVHSGIRRAFERVYEMFGKLRDLANRAGFYNAGDVFNKAYRGDVAGRGRSTLNDLGPTEADESVPIPSTSYKLGEPDRRYFGDPSFSDRMGKKLGGLFNGAKFEENFLDLSAPVRRMQKDLEDRFGKPIDSSRDFYKAKRLLPGKVAGQMESFDEHYVKPLAQEAKANGLTRQDIAEYLFAKHAPERNAAMDAIDEKNAGRGSGISDEEAQNILDRLGADGKIPALDRLEPRIQAIRDHTLDTLTNSGLLSSEQATAWRDQYQNYVPLKGWEDPSQMPDEALAARGPGGVNIRGKETKQAFGRRTVADDPLANLVQQGFQAIQRAERNNAGKVAWRMFRSMPKDEIKDLVTLDRGPEEKYLDPDTGLVAYRTAPGWQQKPGAVGVKIGGKQHYMSFVDPELGEAMKRLSPDDIHAWLRPVESFMRLTSSALTHFSPEFLFKHFFVRYPVEGLLNAGENGPGAMLRSFKGYPGGSLMRAILRGRGMSEEDVNKLNQKVGAGTATKAERAVAYYHEMRAAGGVMDFKALSDLDGIKERLNRSMSRLNTNPIGAAVETGRAAFEAVDRMTSAMDNAQRLAAYVEARERGESPADAAMKAREATIDFSLRGRYSRYINLMWRFGNTALQTGARMGRALRRSSNMRAVVGGVIGLGIASTLYNYMFGGNDKDGTPFFEKVPDYVRRLSMIAMSPFKDSKGRPYFAQIAMPYNYAFPYQAGQAIAQTILKGMGIAKESPGKIIGNLLHAGVEAFSPLAGEESWLGKVTPAALLPFLHVATNEKFSGNPVHPDITSPFDPRKGLAASEQSFRNTPEYWKTLATSLNSFTGGNKGRPGWLDYHPEDYREVLGQATGSLEGLAQHASKAANSVATGNAPSVGNIPFARILMGGDDTYDNADTGKFYDMRKEAYDAEQSIKSLKQSHDIAAVKSAMQDSRGELGAAQIFHGADKARASVYRGLDALDKATNLSADEKDTRTQALKSRETDIMFRARTQAQQALSAHK